MAFSYSLTSPSPNSTLSYSSTHQFLNPSSSFPVSLSVSSPKNTRHLRLLITSALNPQTGQPTKKASTGSDKSSTNKKRKKKGKIAKPVEDWELRDSEDAFEEDDDADYSSSSSSLATFNSPPTIPKPPAGFVINETGRVLMASKKRITTVIDPTNNSPLDCVIRRVFTSSKGEDCMLLCPVDTPVQILKSTNIDGWSAVSDEEVESLLPAAAYALAKIHMHLVHSGFCYTARGGFCYTEDNVFDFRTDDGQDVEGLPTEGVEITCFHLDGSHYMVYTPSDPLLFVAAKDQNGLLQIADDELLDDPAVISAIDEETEFNALVEEEAALLESLLGERI
ncbi:hypothetical protein AtNW77_Chr4g0312371 [Arabidopsis thaliana]|uniref:Uncharacterized protein n=4 Tax=Arabidopsis TaxID=3701 RepID=A0A178V760_ARATH|nr:BTB/POZ domain protein TNFAIP protein [Arabidopsis thaliana]KAG7618275.1 hypothetical protein ISN45_At04g035550 [Arabidopsis thaliana x Arabidopsis arenosa]KAG7622736.1 hypothetical protein ISN44_As04g035030 [Arabidopsis suecica]ABN04840.1 At4g33480 [Arabidopsis thaliana]AEE86232.1 BTB/POZ domain protein TNFAIP protein [Arabidopsis thaliana]OAP00823.1 hypothetical protein AXX17_AT4G38290 [Arabidopsis thaliana]|eukprot:NP_195074.2 BTB/POZ domain protein TNFAIP protein [Arabidopsis thaliana]